MLNTKTFQKAVLCCTLFSLSCQKPAPDPIDFEISGYRNISLTENGSETIALSVTRISGNDEQVTLSMADLPKGISINFSTETSKPDFKSSLYIKDDSSKGGNYEVTLTGRSARGVEREYNFTLTTLDKLCAKKAAGSYTGTAIRRDNNNDTFNTITFTQDPVYADRLLFTWKGKDAYMILNCNRDHITIPYQDVDKYKIQGTGNLEFNYSIINMNLLERHDNGDTVSCTARFVKK